MFPPITLMRLACISRVSLIRFLDTERLFHHKHGRFFPFLLALSTSIFFFFFFFEYTHTSQGELAFSIYLFSLSLFHH